MNLFHRKTPRLFQFVNVHRRRVHKDKSGFIVVFAIEKSLFSNFIISRTPARLALFIEMLIAFVNITTVDLSTT